MIAPPINDPPATPDWGRTLVAAMNNTFSLLSTYLQRVSTSEVVEVYSNSSAGDPILVSHNLGRTPKIATVMAGAAGDFSVTDDDLREWNSKTIKVRFSVANTRLRLEIK